MDHGMPQQFNVITFIFVIALLQGKFFLNSYSTQLVSEYRLYLNLSFFNLHKYFISSFVIALWMNNTDTDFEFIAVFVVIFWCNYCCFTTVFVFYEISVAFFTSIPVSVSFYVQGTTFKHECTDLREIARMLF